MKAIDIYGQRLNMTLKNQQVVKSTLGGYFTILTVLLISAAAYVIGKDIIYKEQPISFTQEDISLKINPVKISSNKDMQIAIEIQNSTNHKFYDEKVLKFNLSLVELTFNEQGTDIIDKNQLPLKIKNCTYDDWITKINRSEYDFLGIDAKNCLDFDQVNLTGSYTETKFKFLKFEVTRSANSEGNKYIDNIITSNQLSINIYSPYSCVDLTNNKKPINSRILTDKKYLVKDRHKEMHIEIVKGTVKTDDGFLFPYWREESFYNLKFNQIDLKDRDTNDMVLITYIFGPSNLQFSHFRKYIKITDIFASLGGVIKSTTLIFGLLNLTFAKIEKMKVITNEVFILKDEEEEINEKGIINLTSSQKLKFKINAKPNNLQSTNKFDKYITTIIPCNSNSRNTNNNLLKTKQMINIPENTDEGYKDYDEILNKLKNRKNSFRLSLSMRDVFNIVCYNKNKQYRRDFQKKLYFYKHCSEKLNDYFDILTIIKKFEEVNQLKKVLLDEDELMVFEQLVRPCLYYTWRTKVNKIENLNEEKIIQKFLRNSTAQKNLFHENILKLL